MRFNSTRGGWSFVDDRSGIGYGTGRGWMPWVTKSTLVGSTKVKGRVKRINGEKWGMVSFFLRGRGFNGRGVGSVYTGCGITRDG